MKITLTLIALFVSLLPLSICKSAEDAMPITVRAAEVQWSDAPPALPAGAKKMIMEGDLSKPGAFTFRIKIPDGYKIPPHFHPGDEHVTVLSGTLFIGHGDQFEMAHGTELTAGSFAVLPKGHHHFAWAKGETILQIHGTGPWGITYVNPTDDPRSKI
jgi:quercetin dioxygenase-like cupin family protein